MVTCIADNAYKPESVDDLDIDFEQFGDFRTMAIAGLNELNSGKTQH